MPAMRRSGDIPQAQPRARRAPAQSRATPDDATVQVVRGGQGAASPWRTDLLARIAESGLPLDALSYRCSGSHTLLRQFLCEGLPDQLEPEQRDILAILLKVPSDSLIDPAPPVVHRSVSTKTRLPPGVPETSACYKTLRHRNIPMVTQGATSGKPWTVSLLDPLEAVECPPCLATTTHPIALIDNREGESGSTLFTALGFPVIPWEKGRGTRLAVRLFSDGGYEVVERPTREEVGAAQAAGEYFLPVIVVQYRP